MLFRPCWPKGPLISSTAKVCAKFTGHILQDYVPRTEKKNKYVSKAPPKWTYFSAYLSQQMEIPFFNIVTKEYEEGR